LISKGIKNVGLVAVETVFAMNTMATTNVVSMTTQKNETILVTMITVFQHLVEMGSKKLFKKCFGDPAFIWLPWKLHILHFEIEIPFASTLVVAMTLYAWHVY